MFDAFHGPDTERQKVAYKYDKWPEPCPQGVPYLLEALGEILRREGSAKIKYTS